MIDGGLELTFGTFGRGCGMFHRFMQVHARQAFSTKTTTPKNKAASCLRLCCLSMVFGITKMNQYTARDGVI